MEAIAKISKTNIVQATRKHTATVFFFHGSGEIIVLSIITLNAIKI